MVLVLVLVAVDVDTGTLRQEHAEDSSAPGLNDARTALREMGKRVNIFSHTWKANSGWVGPGGSSRRVSLAYGFGIGDALPRASASLRWFDSEFGPVHATCTVVVEVTIEFVTVVECKYD
jgi:hypothetical protein